MFYFCRNQLAQGERNKLLSQLFLLARFLFTQLPLKHKNVASSNEFKMNFVILSSPVLYFGENKTGFVFIY
jgi:hypothetical protein